MKVRMLKDARGCDDGIHAAEYEAGREYDVSDALAGAFMGDGVAEDASVPAAPVEPAPERTPAAEAPVVRPKRNAAQKAPKRRKASGKGKA